MLRGVAEARARRVALPATCCELAGKRCQSRCLAGMVLIGMLLLAAVPSWAKTWYVSPTGQDVWPGNKAFPWKTISHALPLLQRGDRLMLKPGRYGETVNLDDLPAGAGAITLQAEYYRTATINGGDAEVAMGATKPLADVNLKGLVITNGGYGLHLANISNVKLIGCEVRGCYYSVSIDAGTGLIVQDTYVHNNKFGFRIGVKDVSGVTGVSFEDCRAAHNMGSDPFDNTDGFVIESLCKNISFHHCVAYEHGDSGFDVKPNDVTFDRCAAYRNNESGFKLFGSGLVLSDCLTYHNFAFGIITGGNNLKFWNCTAVADGYYSLSLEGTNPGSVFVRNCIFAETPVEVDHSTMFRDNANLYYDSQGHTMLILGNRDYTTAQLAGAASPLGKQSMVGDPLFQAPATDDYHLRGGSPALGAGIWTNLVRVDLEGRRRQVGAPPDLGVYTATASGDCRPTAPTAVVVTPKIAYAASDLAATATGSTDPDPGTAISYQYQWSKSVNRGVTWSAWGQPGKVVSHTLTAEGEQWRVRARATDGISFSRWTLAVPIRIRPTPAPGQLAQAPPAMTVAATTTRSGLTQITINLAAAASVQAQIRNLAGRIVAVLPPRDLPAGISTLLWNGTCTSGTRAPRGRYLIQMAGSTPAGEQARALASVIR